MKQGIESIQQQKRKKNGKKQQTINTLIKNKVTLLTDFQKSNLPHTKISNCRLIQFFLL